MEKLKLGCKVHGCNREFRALEMCLPHYNLMRRTPDTVLPIKIHCNNADCLNSHYKSGYCEEHYAKIKESIDGFRSIGCRVVSCEGKHSGNGYCGKHFQQMLSNGKLTDGGTIMHIVGEPTCTLAGCNEPLFGKEYCAEHFRLGKDVDSYFVDNNTQCKIATCNKRIYGHDYCKVHYKKYIDTGKTCIVKTCNHVTFLKKDYCIRHFTELKTHSRILTP